jgi:hypothetical protein
MEAMASRGWLAPRWSTDYGGGGLSVAEAGILQEEMGRIGARPPIFSCGLWMLAPILFEYGTEAQRQSFLPSIARGEIRWCQGYSSSSRVKRRMAVTMISSASALTSASGKASPGVCCACAAPVAAKIELARNVALSVLLPIFIYGPPSMADSAAKLLTIRQFF